MELGVSAWTRRDRLERIASAERDRRAGRVELALAVLGEGTEWPARVVMALARLPRDEGAETRVLLEQSLDAWAAECGLDPLGAFETSGAREPASAPEPADARSDAMESAETLPAASVEPLAAPLEHDELERAFAEAEAQTDEMHSVNTVAERVLLGEELGDDDFADSGLVPVEAPFAARDESDETTGEARRAVASEQTDPVDPVDAAWGAAPIWPEPRAFDSFREEAEALRADFDAIAPDAASAPSAAGTKAAANDVDADTLGEPGLASGRSRATVLATLERWLVNLEKSRAGRAE